MPKQYEHIPEASPPSQPNLMPGDIFLDIGDFHDRNLASGVVFGADMARLMDDNQDRQKNIRTYAELSDVLGKISALAMFTDYASGSADSLDAMMHMLGTDRNGFALMRGVVMDQYRKYEPGGIHSGLALVPSEPVATSQDISHAA